MQRIVAISGIVAIVAVAALIVSLFGTASESQLTTFERHSCTWFAFVDQRFLTPTRTETVAQRAVTAEFATLLRQSVADCIAAGYVPKEVLK